MYPQCGKSREKDVANRPDCRADGDFMCLHGTDDMNCCLPDPDPSKRRDQHGCLEASQQYVDKNWGSNRKRVQKRFRVVEVKTKSFLLGVEDHVNRKKPFKKLRIAN